jgi:hypothetical protein
MYEQKREQLIRKMLGDDLYRRALKVIQKKPLKTNAQHSRYGIWLKCIDCWQWFYVSNDIIAAEDMGSDKLMLCDKCGNREIRASMGQ